MKKTLFLIVLALVVGFFGSYFLFEKQIVKLNSLFFSTQINGCQIYLKLLEKKEYITLKNLIKSDIAGAKRMMVSDIKLVKMKFYNNRIDLFINKLKKDSLVCDFSKDGTFVLGSNKEKICIEYKNDIIVCYRFINNKKLNVIKFNLRQTEKKYFIVMNKGL